jgi:thiosulfate/3-mercaptopyruvate sulfurtransferase
MKREDMIIEAEELMKKLGDENIRIFDATITDDVYRQRHIAGAAFFDHEKFSDPTRPYMYTILEETKLAEQIGKAGMSNDSEVILYACGTLPYAIRAWWILRYAGHQKVKVLNGGLSAWEKAGGQVENSIYQFQPAQFKPQFNPSLFASKDEVQASIENGKVAIVNVLPPESYKASHIAGSINLPCMDLMDGLDYFLPEEKLAERLKDISRYDRIITYCGGGIAAAVNAAAHSITGHENVAVYDGSMYEWLGEGLPVIGTGKWEVWFQ